MFLRRVKAALAICSVLFLAVGVIGAQKQANMDQDSAAIKQSVAAWEDAWNHHDAHATAMRYVEDGDFSSTTAVDSHGWKDFPAQMALVETAQREAKQRLILCDLNWTRLDNLRFALAQFFDHPASHHRLAKISKVRIDFAPGFRSTAILFVGWLAAQLNWQIDEVKSSGELQFTGPSGRHIDVEVREHDGEPVHELRLTSGDVEFRVTYANCGDLLEVSRVQAEKRMPQLMPAGKNDPVDLISAELSRGGPHHVYLNALNCVRQLM